MKVNSVGLRRSGMAPERIEILQEAFRHLFRRRHPTLRHAFDALRDDGIASPEVERLQDFLLAMSKGRNGRAREAVRH